MEEVFERFPDFVCGVVVCSNVENKGEDQTLTKLMREVETDIRSHFVLESLSQNPYFLSWRKAYSAFRTDPTKFKCSSEALVRRVLKGDSIRHINKLVDAYNYISLKCRTPVGGEDLAAIKETICLRFADGDEHFVALGGVDEEHVEKGEVIYATGKEVLCRKWNWRESDRTKLTENTKNAILVIDALPPLTKEDVKKSADDLSTLVSESCNAKTAMFVLNAENNRLSW